MKKKNVELFCVGSLRCTKVTLTIFKKSLGADAFFSALCFREESMEAAAQAGGK